MKRLLLILTIAAWGVTGCGAAKNSGEDAKAENRPSKDEATRDMQPPQANIEVQEDAATRKAAMEQKVDEQAAEAAARSESGRQMNADGGETQVAATTAVDTSTLPAAPGWRLPNLAGEVVSNSDFAGKVMILDFWATWCGPCRMEIPHFIELQQTYGGQGLEIVGVAMDQQGAMVVKPFVDQAGVNYRTVIGNAEVANLYGPIRGIPTTFVISQDGKIYKKYVGYRPKEIFEADIRALLGKS
jgi:thiol-disulfide isomerase/thioredoxin